MEQLSVSFFAVGVLMWLLSPLVVLFGYFLDGVWDYAQDVSLRAIGSVLIIIGLLMFRV